MSSALPLLELARDLSLVLAVALSGAWVVYGFDEP